MAKRKSEKFGYQPLKKGYQPGQAPKDPKPPKGGTGLASRSSNQRKPHPAKKSDGET